MSILTGTLRALLDASPFLLGGFLVAGLLHELLPVGPVQKNLGSRSLRSILAGTFLGVPLPLCSCSVLPAAVALRRKGASREATLAFLVSTPETGVDSIALTYGLFGPVIAALRPLVAIVSGILAGLVALRDRTPAGDLPPDAGSGHVDAEVSPEQAVAGEAPATLRLRLRRAVRYGFVTLFDELAFFLAASFAVAGVLAGALPEGFFARAFPSDLAAILAMALLGVPTYVCASASTPLAAAMVAKGLNPGAALVFMLTGPATNLGTIAVVGRLFGRRFLGAYLAAIFGVAIAAGLLLNAALGGGRTLPPPGAASTSALFTALSFLSAVAFLALLAASARRGSFQHAVKDLAEQGRESLVLLRGLRFRVRWRLVATASAVLALAVALRASVVVVRPGERGLVQLFGRVVGRELQPGLHVVPPPPIAGVTLVATDATRVAEIGYRTRTSAGAPPATFPQPRDPFTGASEERIAEESRYLTGDENVVEVAAVLLYRVADAKAFLLGVEQVEPCVRSLARALLVGEISKTPIDAVYSTDRARVEERALSGLAASATVRRLGVAPLAVRLLYVHAPEDVHRSFRDVASAQEDRARARNLAEAAAVEVVGLARGDAARTVTEAETERLTGVSRAKGEAEVFTAVASSVRSAPTTRQRLYLETVERALAPLRKIIRPASPEVDLWMTAQPGIAGFPMPGDTNAKPPPSPTPGDRP